MNNELNNGGKMRQWVDVDNGDELKIGERVRLADDRCTLESGFANGDGCEEAVEVIVHPDGRVACRCEAEFGGFQRGDVFKYFNYVQALREYPDPPTLAIATGLHKQAYGLAGWAEFYQWALVVDSTLRRIDEECAAEGYSELDTLRLICAGLLKEKFGVLS